MFRDLDGPGWRLGGFRLSTVRKAAERVPQFTVLVPGAGVIQFDILANDRRAVSVEAVAVWSFNSEDFWGRDVDFLLLCGTFKCLYEADWLAIAGALRSMLFIGG